jgi:biopolymer transport protein ExbB
MARLTVLHIARRLIASSAFVMLLTSAAHAASWWNDEWPTRKKITIDTSEKGAPITDPIGTTAVLLRLHDGNFNFGAVKEDASDLRFVAADDKTVLAYHIEKFDSLLNEAFVWVKIPDLKPGAQTSIWMYLGNAGPKAVKVEDAKGTFDADTVLVYHFAEKNAPAADASGNGNNASNAVGSVEGSQIGGGARLDGKTPVTVPTSPTLMWPAGGSVTLTAWVKPTALAPKQILVSRREGSNSFAIGVDNGALYVDVNGQRSPAGAAPLAVNAWRHLAVVAEAGKVSLYLDGELYSSLGAPMPALNGPLLIGGDSANGAVNFTGEVDEVELSKVARPLGFIKMEAFSQGADKGPKMVAVGADEEPTNWLAFLNNGYFGIIIKSLTLDGWVVIAILAFMSALSWFVMIRKNSVLTAISKSNERFMKEWHHVASDLTVLDEPDDQTIKTMGGRMDKKGLRAMRSSPIYRIYHTGVGEIRNRLSGSSGQMKFLSALSMQAIRATLDGAMVRETQRINNLIVFLTLSISGGPFLGLLGTVVGVMITFAAVAAAGDVNVNAIAPGIAAALLATVAGLAVAIPALFGYNYLLARIKNATSDMHVFIDEFITKTAEYYSRGEITAASTMRLPKPNVVSKLAAAPEQEKPAAGLDGAVETPAPRSGAAAPSSNFPMKMEIARPRLPDPASEN